MTFTVDKDLCIGCGICADLCPEVFEMQDDVSTVIKDPVDKAYQPKALAAEDACPVHCINH